MRQALNLARKGLGRTAPNPAVGAVIVQGEQIIAKGYHRKAGGDHAEVDALKKMQGRAPGATMYVTLEPCNHVGRTPPCTNAILESGIKRVVIGMSDPNPRVK
ncbi:MAG: bifunctional diaminohydroxyphosphoribosylaminopyrimidine deaminase/5-amino-6-(5-phosphoribosylamino)uracil reductase RibD, partial [Deltaproteobacteria bacterium]